MTAGNGALVGEFCASLPELEADGDQAVRSALNAALERLRDSQESPPAVVDAFWQALGLSESLRTVDIPKVPSTPPQGSYGCPRQVCNRRADRGSGGPMPFCPVYRESMVFRP
jgi:hypothetical protein